VEGGGEPRAQAAPARPNAGHAITSVEALAAFDEAWQTIHDTHFDPTFNGVDWDALRAELRPRAEKAETREEVREVIGEMLDRLGQSHFAVFPGESLPDGDGPGAEDHSAGLGFDVREREGQLLVTAVEAASSAEAAGVRAGWVVRRIGSFDAEEAWGRLVEAGDALGEHRAAFHMWAAARSNILGTQGTRDTVVFRDGEDREVELELERKPRAVTAHEVGPTLPKFYLEFSSSVLERDGKRIGLIRFSNWFLPVMRPLDEAVDAMRGLDGIVIDLRGNTGGAAAMTMGIAGHFFDESTRLGVMTTRDSTMKILAIPRRTNPSGESVQPYAGPVALLIDETTGSASEVFAGGLQSVARARVFGDTSAGAVLPAMTTRLPNGDALLHAMGDFETATGTRLEGVGVVPDERVPVGRQDLLAGRDAPLEAALAWIASRTP
jgi:carboxyl-terminal processing protease